MVYEIKDESLLWLIEVVVCLLVAPQFKLFTGPGNEYLHNELQSFVFN